MKDPVILVGAGEMGGVFARAVGCIWVRGKEVTSTYKVTKYRPSFNLLSRTTGINERRISMKSLPARPNLEYLKKEAKKLRSAHRNKDKLVSSILSHYDTSFTGKTEDEIFASKFSILDAQRVIAREYGFSSRTKLKRFKEVRDEGGRPPKNLDTFNKKYSEWARKNGWR